MPPRFEELDYRETPLGGLSLRRRTMTSLDNLQVHEIILGTEFLMSSMFTEVEEQLSWLGIAAAVEVFGSAHQGEDSYLDVVIGGLGLGYTARAALESTAVKSLMVVDYLEPVIEWHQQGLVPLGKGLTDDTRDFRCPVVALFIGGVVQPLGAETGHEAGLVKRASCSDIDG